MTISLNDAIQLIKMQKIYMNDEYIDAVKRFICQLFEIHDETLEQLLSK